MTLAATTVGAHDTMVEIHPDPDHAPSDGPQSLYFKEFEKLMKKVKSMAEFMQSGLG